MTKPGRRTRKKLARLAAMRKRRPLGGRTAEQRRAKITIGRMFQ